MHEIRYFLLESNDFWIVILCNKNYEILDEFPPLFCRFLESRTSLP
jgi:hypothetical protein